jgi:hypothetical protein
MIGGTWHPNYKCDAGEEGRLAEQAMRWAVWINETMEDPDGWAFVAAAVEAFTARVIKEDTKGPWEKYAELFWRDEYETIVFRTPDWDDEDPSDGVLQ